MYNPNEQPADVIFFKPLGWHEWDEYGDQVPAAIMVVDANIGYNVIRTGCQFWHLHWELDREDAIYWAVDRSRADVAAHEIKQSERD